MGLGIVRGYPGGCKVSSSGRSLDRFHLVGFGLDSAIEVASGAALLWWLHHDLNPFRREQVEQITLRIAGWCFIALAVYMLYESCSALILHEPPDRSIPGIIIAAISVVVMPLLARAKRRVAYGSGAEPCKRIPGRRTSVRGGNPDGSDWSLPFKVGVLTQCWPDWTRFRFSAQDRSEAAPWTPQNATVAASAVI